MNIFKKIYCRISQFFFKMCIPFLPYKEPELLKTDSDVSSVLKSHNIQSVLLVTGKRVRSLNLTKSLENELLKNQISVSIFDGTTNNPTIKNVEEAYEIYKNNNCQAIIAFGGGSIMDCAKVVGAKVTYPNKPISKMKGVMKILKKTPLLIAVPTTAGTGSETTLAAVITDSENKHKYVISSFPLIPSYALLNPKLTTCLPKDITATTGMDALTHAIEAYIGNSTTKQTKKASLEAIKLIFENLEMAYNNPNDLKARENMLNASYLAGTAFTKSYVGYIHSIAHSIGGKYNTAHGLANAVIMPHILKMYGKSIHKKLWKIGIFVRLFNKEISYSKGAEIIILKIEELNSNLNIQTQLPEIQNEDISELAKTAEKEANPLYPVPKLFSAKELEQVYHQIKCEK